MKIDQGWFTDTFEDVTRADQISDKNGQVLVFVLGSMNDDDRWYTSLRTKYPNAAIISCSSSEVIIGQSMLEKSIGYTAIQFDRTPFRVNQLKIDDSQTIFEAGKRLVEPLVQEDLTCVLLFSDGKSINGSEMISGVNSVLGQHVIVTGGMASDLSLIHI